MTVDEILENYRFKADRISARPDGLMASDDPGVSHYRIIITGDERAGNGAMVCYYTMGSAYRTYKGGGFHYQTPKLADVLESLISDALIYETMTVDEYAEDFCSGQSYSEITAGWNAIERLATDVKNVLGDDFGRLYSLFNGDES